MAGDTATHAFVTVNGVMTDLNSLLAPEDAALWELKDARGINDAGQVVGTGTFNGQTRAFVLTPTFAPVPVPGAVWLMGSALIGMVGLGSRKAASLPRE